MKSANKVSNYFQYASIIFVLVVLVVVYGYRYSQPLIKKDTKTEKTATASITKPEAKKMAPGAACCKVSFSRAKMLSVKNAHTNITPARK